MSSYTSAGVPMRSSRPKVFCMTPGAARVGSSAVARDERRPTWALFLLLGVVLTVTLQLVSGLLLALGWIWLLPFHIIDGLVAALFLAGEWSWLLGYGAGRRSAARIFLFSATTRRRVARQWRNLGRDGTPLREGLDAAVAGIFLLLASVTVILGILLWRGAGDLLPWHRSLAAFLLLLWVLHLAFSIIDHWPRRGRKGVSP